MWDGGDKMKSQKDLAKGAKLGVKDDVKILDYYRYIDVLCNIIILSNYCLCLLSGLFYLFRL